ncbi:hypothetical protein F5884DRAFT_551064 [Xylogone sp. PMI_703]|nr:hypothetical protein F5884DRAFT_551064 [Xylogone sp. PMI_703]
MSYPHNCVLMVGATSGIGLAMAEKFIASGSKVIVVGRRKDRLDAFVAKHGAAKAGAVAFNVTDAVGIPAFVETVTSKYPEIDCVFLNAGKGNAFRFAEPTTIDLNDFHKDIELNFLSHVNLTHAFLPFLMSKEVPTTMTYTGSLLSLVPAAGGSSYCASKAALNAFIMSVREELSHANSKVKIVEIFPPPVQSVPREGIIGGHTCPSVTTSEGVIFF